MKPIANRPALAARNRRSGLALTEVLICSTIAAMLLTATAVAFRASVQSYRDNTERNMLISSGRVALRQLINEIRQADSHTPINDTTNPNATTQFAAGTTIENTGIVLLKTRPDVDEPAIVNTNSATYVLITWSYDSGTKQLSRTRQVGTQAAVTTVMTTYVDDFKVRMEPTRSAANVAAGNTSFDLLLRGVVTLTLRNRDATGNEINAQGNGLVTERLLDSAVPRKNFSGV